MKDKTRICSVCFGEYEGFGNNALPINDGRCCDECNNLVIVARLNFSKNRDKWAEQEKQDAVDNSVESDISFSEESDTMEE